MDINDISINYLIKNAGLLQYFEWGGAGTFTAECGQLTFEVDTFNRDIAIRDKDSDSKVKFRHIWPAQMQALLDAIEWDMEEGEAA